MELPYTVFSRYTFDIYVNAVSFLVNLNENLTRFLLWRHKNLSFSYIISAMSGI